MLEQFREKAVAAEMSRQTGQLARAEEQYLDLVAWLVDGDRADLAGMVYNNLGMIAEEAGRWSDAVEYYQKAISTLEGLDVMDDEDGLQCGHACYNVARILRSLDDDRFEAYARKAIERYRSTPLASDADIRDVEQLGP